MTGYIKDNSTLLSGTAISDIFHHLYSKVIIYVASNQTVASNKTFISWTLINSNKWSVVGNSWNPGTCALI